MNRKIAQLAAVALTLFASSPAFAHEDAKGPHGGQVIDAAGHHIEFVPSPQALTLFLTDAAGKPIASEGTTAKAIVQDGGKTSSIDLVPADPDMLTAKLASPLGAGAKIAVTATMADGHKLQALYVAP